MLAAEQSNCARSQRWQAAITSTPRVGAPTWSSRVCLAGATGWAGSELARSIAASSDIRLVAAVSRTNPGRRLGEVLGDTRITCPIYASATEARRAATNGNGKPADDAEIPSPHRARAPFDTPATGLHALDNPWQESYVAAYVVSEAEYECVQAPRFVHFQPLADTQL